MPDGAPESQANGSDELLALLAAQKFEALDICKTKDWFINQLTFGIKKIRRWSGVDFVLHGPDGVDYVVGLVFHEKFVPENCWVAAAKIAESGPTLLGKVMQLRDFLKEIKKSDIFKEDIIAFFAQPEDPNKIPTGMKRVINPLAQK